ncbi:DUF935 domain-containing protein [Nocardioides sp. TRM66260-LWL]|uniref:phage portal protein family protein n=1 Tax=Nocardioides sp. TRM66260-LWL TaxID=2874478 RepID=UPI001CC4708C|nr:DUF935 family protein [Nocardioides sp. TRM66260-LWL]MBZ5736484.1 DUF935 domain-containing protein [Nocardioides sp. TRM66260-LWL]
MLSAVIMPILRTGWRLDGTDCNPDVTRHIANDLGLPVIGEGDRGGSDGVEDRFSWGEHLRTALPEYCGYGHSIYEPTAYWNDLDGRWHLRKVGYRPPRTITKFNVASDGGLISIEQRPPAAGVIDSLTASKTRALSADRLLVYSRWRKGGRWRGRSMLRAAYEPWLLRARAVRVEMILAERTGSPVPVYEASPNETDLASGRALASSIRSGQTAGAAVPNGAKLRLLGYEGQLPDIDKPKRYNDEQIARAVLAHFLNLGTQTGSWALGSTFADFFTLSLQATADEIAETFTRHLIRKAVRWNWPAERIPRLVPDEIGSRQEAVVTAVAQLVRDGVLKPDEDLERFVRTSLGLPARSSSTPPPTTA